MRFLKRRQASGRDGGFLLALGLNLLFQGEWLLAAFGALVLHYLFEIPLFLVWLALGIWILAALAVTVLLSWASDSANAPEQSQGQRISERLRKRDQEKNEE